jgi:restriction system protein
MEIINIDSPIAWFIALLILTFILVPGKKRSKRKGSRSKLSGHSKSERELLVYAGLLTFVWFLFVAIKLLDFITKLFTGGDLPSFGWIDLILTAGIAGSWYLVIQKFGKGLAFGRKRDERYRTIAELNDLSPDEFEHFVADLFRSQGYKAKVIGQQGDHGVDIEVVNPSKERELVQCKKWRSRWLGEKVVRDFYGAFMHDQKAVRGYIVTTNYYSEAAKEWAKGKPIDLIDGDRLVEAIKMISGKFA